jgi:carboxyl-terminal processing protease
MIKFARRHTSVRLTCVAVATLAVLLPGQLAAQEALSPTTEEEYELMKLFVETYEQIGVNYVRDVDRRELMEAAIQGMLNHLDQYSSYIPPQSVRRFDQTIEQEFGGIGIQVNGLGGRLTVVSPLPGTPAWRAGVRSGDVIEEVDGKSTEGYTVQDAVGALQGPPGRPVVLGVRRPGEEELRQLRMLREVIQVPTVHGDSYDPEGNWKFMLNPEQKIGFVRISHFSKRTTEELEQAIDGLVEDGLRGLILDLRNNPGGLLESAIEIADLFLEEGKIVSVKGRNVPERSWDARRRGTYENFPMVVLVNRYSASASEVVSAALQDNERAMVVGERTWGKGSVQNVIRMEGGDAALKLTTASYFRPSGVNIHRFPDSKPEDNWGVSPSEGMKVSLSPDEWDTWYTDRRQRDVIPREGEEISARSDQDPQLSKALAWLTEQLDKPTPDNDAE